MIYSSNLPSSFGLGNCTYDVIAEWDRGGAILSVELGG